MAKKRETKLTNRSNAANQFRSPLDRFRGSLAEIRPLWDRLDPEQRATIEAKDPVLQMARALYDELGGFFDA